MSTAIKAIRLLQSQVPFSNSQDIPLGEMPSHMLGVLYYQPGDIRLETVVCRDLQPGEILVKIETALTCGTDLKAFRRGHPVLLKNLPSPFGHEGAGLIQAIGSDVQNVVPGDRIVFANSAPCGHCFYCDKGHLSLCENLNLLNGTYAQYLTLPARIVQKNIYKLPDHVRYDEAAMTEPLAACVRGIEACNIQQGDQVAVIGIGTIGQFLMKLARHKGAEVTGFSRQEGRKSKLAFEFAGAKQVICSSLLNDPLSIRSSINGGRGFDVVFEAVGLSETWGLAQQLVRPGGVINFFGGCRRGTQVAFDTHQLHYQEVKILSTFHHTPEHFQKALELISDGVINPRALISHSFPLTLIHHALDLMADGQALKVAITPHQE